MSLEQSFITNIVEAALMAAGQPLSVDKLHSLFVEQQDVEKEHIKQALVQLSEDLDARGVELKEVSSGYRIQAKQDFAPWLAKLWEEKPPRYSRAVLETMVLIAYRQPITRGEIEDVRGVSVSSHIVKSLMERDWIRVVGHRDVPGRPALYATTKGFLDYFNLKSLDELPSLSEIKDLDSINAQLQLSESESQQAEVTGVDTIAATDESDTAAGVRAAQHIDSDSGMNEQVDTVETPQGAVDDDSMPDKSTKSGFFTPQPPQEEESSDALDAVDEALSVTKDVLERFERAVFHKKEEDVSEEESDIDSDDQREELAITEAVQSLAQTVLHDETAMADSDGDDVNTSGKNEDVSDAESDSDSEDPSNELGITEAVESLAQAVLQDEAATADSNNDNDESTDEESITMSALQQDNDLNNESTAISGDGDSEDSAMSDYRRHRYESAEN